MLATSAITPQPSTLQHSRDQLPLGRSASTPTRSFTPVASPTLAPSPPTLATTTLLSTSAALPPASPKPQISATHIPAALLKDGAAAIVEPRKSDSCMDLGCVCRVRCLQGYPSLGRARRLTSSSSSDLRHAPAGERAFGGMGGAAGVCCHGALGLRKMNAGSMPDLDSSCLLRGQARQRELCEAWHMVLPPQVTSCHLQLVIVRQTLALIIGTSIPVMRTVCVQPVHGAGSMQQYTAAS